MSLCNIKGRYVLFDDEAGGRPSAANMAIPGRTMRRCRMRMDRSRFRHLATCAVVVVATAACGGDSRPTTPVSPTPPSPPPQIPNVAGTRSPADRAAVPPASAPLRRKRAVAHDVEAQFSTVVTPALGAGHPVDRVHRTRVLGGNPRFSPTISEVKATDQQRPAQAPYCSPWESGRRRTTTTNC